MPRILKHRSVRLLALVLLLLTAGAVSGSSVGGGKVSSRPNILLISIDTLRADHVSAFGYERNTTPRLDRVIRRGVRFEQARTVEPLTNPSLTSLITSRYPHQHGASRNGIKMREDLDSLPKSLTAGGYRTAAFVGNWTLRDKISGLGEHFNDYLEVLTRARWFGIVRSEATAEDLTESSLGWLAQHRKAGSDAPYFAWVHYVEPHAPYRARKEFLTQLGIPKKSNLSAAERYDTEIAYVDRSIGELLDGLERLKLMDNTIVVFLSDHGESLGEHDYWGHGRHLYETTLRVPMSITWEGHLESGAIAEPALLLDIAPTLLNLVGLQTPSSFEGFDWTPFLGGETPPAHRLTRYQAHKGAVISRHDSDLARKSGLLEVGLIRDNIKEIFRIPANRRQTFHLGKDPGENGNLSHAKENPTEGLQTWMRQVYTGLGEFDQQIPQPLDEESAEVLKSLGYVD